MSDQRINLAELREWVSLRADAEVAHVSIEELRALVEAVVALRMATAFATGADLRNADRVLARFDFGERP